jgi:hypothetical protein
LKNSGKNSAQIIYSQQIEELFKAAKEMFNTNDVELMGFVGGEGYERFIKNEIDQYIYTTQVFITSGRSFFANIQASIYSLFGNKQNIDPFLLKFGEEYSTVRNKHRHYHLEEIKTGVYPLFDSVSREILNADYLLKKDGDFLIHEDGRIVDILNASSGQQEILPLLLILRSLLKKDGLFSSDGETVYIEEPETHLFPDSQKNIVELISLLFNNPEIGLNFVITTHSPYILTSFNNLIQAGEIEKRAKANKDKLAKLYKIVPKEMILAPEVVNAYEFDGKTAYSIVNKKTKLIKASHIDTVSEEIGLQFDELLSLY